MSVTTNHCYTATLSNHILCYLFRFLIVNQRLLNQWKDACTANNIVLPVKAITELKKRIKQSETNFDIGKAKLNLSQCSLDDKMVSFLQIFRLLIVTIGKRTLGKYDY